ncbi:MAG: hypothetical protein H6707_18300 [Deltaproteobacteria bacterium]|nr:hypothetical protein [Deltaproteobacteria bacterium]
MTVRLAIALCVLCFSAFAGVAEAQAPADQATDRQTAARLHYQKASRAYRLGEFATALEQFKAASRLSERPSLLFNIAQCHRQLRQYERATFFYKLYLSEWERQNPGRPAPFAQEVDRRLSELRQQHVDDSRKSSSAVSPAKPVARPPAPPAALRFDRAQPLKPLLPRPIYKRWWFWTAIGVVVAGGATATALALGAERKSAPSGSLDPGVVGVD